MNKFDLIRGVMKNGMTPKGVVKSMAGNNPIMNNLIQMAEKGDNKGVEQFARNVLKERGIDFDKEFGEMKKTFNIQ